MRISEIVLWNNDPAEGNRSNPHLDFPPGPFDADLTNLASAFTKDGEVKRFWDLNRLEGQPSVPAPPDAETELIPNGTLEPNAASWQVGPVKTERPVVQNWLVPVRQQRSRSASPSTRLAFGPV